MSEVSNDKRPYPLKARERIQVGQILERLHKHLIGEVELSSTQLQAAKILLSKALPDLQSVVYQNLDSSKPFSEMNESELNEWIARATGGFAGDDAALSSTTVCHSIQ